MSDFKAEMPRGGGRGRGGEERKEWGGKREYASLAF